MPGAAGCRCAGIVSSDRAGDTCVGVLVEVVPVGDGFEVAARPLTLESPVSGLCGGVTLAGGLPGETPLRAGPETFGPPVGVPWLGPEGLAVTGPPPPVSDTFELGPFPEGEITGGVPTVPVLPVFGANAAGALVAVLPAGEVLTEVGEAGPPGPVPVCAGASTGGAIDDRVTPSGGDAVRSAGRVPVGAAWAVSAGTDVA